MSDELIKGLFDDEPITTLNSDNEPVVSDTEPAVENESAQESEILPEYEEKHENLKQYQPDTRIFRSGIGPDAWWSTSYIRTKEIMGAADLRVPIIDNESGKV